MYKILGTDDSTNVCDCCGKTGLKYTVAVEIGGRIMHYGSVCATRHTGKTSKEIKLIIKTDIEARKAAAIKVYHFPANTYQCKPR